MFQKHCLQAKHPFPYVIVVMRRFSISSCCLIFKDQRDLFYRGSSSPSNRIRYAKKKQQNPLIEYLTLFLRNSLSLFITLLVSFTLFSIDFLSFFLLTRLVPFFLFYFFFIVCRSIHLCTASLETTTTIITKRFSFLFLLISLSEP